MQRKGDGEGRAGPDRCRGEGDAILAWREGRERACWLEGVQEGDRVLWYKGKVGRGGRIWEVVAGQGEIVYAELASSQPEERQVVNGWRMSGIIKSVKEFTRLID